MKVPIVLATAHGPQVCPTGSKNGIDGTKVANFVAKGGEATLPVGVYTYV